ncbi:MAG: N-acetyltransferase [Pseudomonadales bacterium]|nr:N-acetyltransferase [Pseudomonadales bacterium]
MQIEWLKGIHQCDENAWDKLNTTNNPFLKHCYFTALEKSACTNTASGWEPHHLIVREEDGQMLAAMPLYIKYHSYGEYVFDWSWANAWRSCGLEYYPKLLTAVPFTPSTGPRILLTDQLTQEQTDSVYRTVIENLFERCKDGYSGWHILFPEKAVSDRLVEYGCLQRMGYQFHWFNRDYQHFDDFTDSFTSRKRKNIKKERARVKSQGFVFKQLRGTEIDDALWQKFYTFYQLTYLKRSGHHGYLNLDFFRLIGQSMQDNLMMAIAIKDSEVVAAALNFVDSATLYGRYWGCLEEYDFLHFETCYYQGIEFCIREKLARFDAGAQGEHKIQRGFEPVPIWSNHLIRHNELADAIRDFLAQEKLAVKNYLSDCKQVLPFNTFNR